jgi:hypothetical protein
MATALAFDGDAAPDPKGMDDDELASILAAQEKAAISFRDSTLADEQANALDYYEAEPFGDEEDGRSQVVVPDVAEVVDYMQISVLRTCVSGDRVVEFEPSDSEDMPDLPDMPDEPQAAPGQQPDPQAVMAYQQAKQQFDQANAAVQKWEKDRTKAADDATETINYIFMSRQNGSGVLLSWVQSGLIEKIGIVKTACVTERKKDKQRQQVDEMTLTMLMDQGANITAATDNGDGSFLVEITTEREIKSYVDYPIPSEEYLFSARTRDEDSAEYQAHRCRKTLSDLVEMGFDRETVYGLPTDDGPLDLDERSVARWQDEENYPTRQTEALRKVWLLEEYARIDRDDDGVAELLKIFRVGDVILESEEVDEAPFVTWCPFPRAHRMVGNSLAEKVMDIQRINSVLLRQSLDGVYMTNNPRTWLPDECVTENTIDDLLNVRSGGLVRGKGGVNKPEPLYEPFDIQKSLGMLEYMTGLRETRTGITRLNQGLDEDTLNKTASGQAALQATGQQIEEFVARNFVEAMGRLFAKKLRLMADHGSAMAIKVDGRYRKVDPGAWERDMLVSVRAGLGSGRKDQRLAYRQSLALQQQEGLALGITDAKRVFNNVSAMVRDAGLGTPTDYWIDPESEEGKAAQQSLASKPDPEMAKVQAQAQQAQAKMQIDAQSSQQQLSLQQQESAAKLSIAQQEGQQNITLAAAKAEQEQELARQKADFEAQLAVQTADREYQLALMQEQNRHELATMQAQHSHEVNMKKAASVGQKRPGGDLSK